MEKEAKGWNHVGILGHRWVHLIAGTVNGGTGIFDWFGWHE